MKVAFVGPYKEGSGYSHSIIDHILALDSAGVDVVPRNIRMSQGLGELPDRIKELEKGDLNNVDTLIQYNLPSEFVYRSGVQNIGMFCYETDSFPNANWRHGLSLMNKIVVSSEFQREAIIKTCGVEYGEKTYVLKHPVDTNKFAKRYEVMDLGLPKNCVKFYSIAEWNRRKNIPAMLAAYYAEFGPNDNVALIIKTSGGSDTEFKGICKDLKQKMGLYADESLYPKIVLMTDRLTDYEICCLHETADVFVSTSHGEAICLPFLDSLGFGNLGIVPNGSAFSEYAAEDTVLIDSHLSTVFGVSNAPEGLYTADELWENISIPSLREKMRGVYETVMYAKAHDNADIKHSWITILSHYEKAGKELKGIINAK